MRSGPDGTESTRTPFGRSTRRASASAPRAFSTCSSTSPRTTESKLSSAKGSAVTSASTTSPPIGGEVVEADVTALPFADESFDSVVLGEVLEHVENARGALAEARRVLRPNGVLVLSVPSGPERMGPSDRWAGHLRRYDRSGLVALC